MNSDSNYDHCSQTLNVNVNADKIFWATACESCEAIILPYRKSCFWRMIIGNCRRPQLHGMKKALLFSQSSCFMTIQMFKLLKASTFMLLLNHTQTIQ